ncbi:hypothetical protein E1B28_005416 [Marasmius oreades]|uniref:Glycosyl hydrolase family 92 domain-containing protein n=1 Tax=Marasmius oreades TaxID=181124 RepID=A0A9P7UVN6_9AGAR|nr:uncharacterized protein E1B28_005416 [Marasmius oreades]KAG7094591.1 hypothetical protein E1B28_005416 [Marasmius oreades]
MPFMYHYANRPGLSTQRSRQVIAQNFDTTPGGLPGNDDSGSYILTTVLTFVVLELHQVQWEVTRRSTLLGSIPYQLQGSFCYHRPTSHPYHSSTRYSTRPRPSSQLDLREIRKTELGGRSS